jgi:predicted nucleic acid-binding protein
MATVLLNSGPVGLLTHPHNPPPVVACRQWVARLQAAGWRVILPEITDYEIRRELLLRGSTVGINHLDWLAGQLEYLPLTTAAMRQAAEFWAAARKAGAPTAGPHELDGDAILAAQAVTLGEPQFVVATSNVGHLARFVPADLWQNGIP